MPGGSRPTDLPWAMVLPVLRAIVVAVVSFAVAAGCSDSQRSGDSTTSRAASSTTETTGSKVTATSPETTSTAATTTTGAPPTTVALAPLTLTGDGVGTQAFGASADAVVSALVAELGTPVDDRVETAVSSSYGVCPGNQLRVVEWGGFAVLFSDGATPYAPGGTFTFFDWQLRNLGAATPPLSTREGIALGDPIGELRSAYPGAALVDDEIVGPSFNVGPATDSLRGSLTSINDDGTVVALAAGSACGE